MESLLLDNWRKNSHDTVDIIYCLRSPLVSGFLSFTFQTFFATVLLNPRRSKGTLASKLKDLETAFCKFSGQLEFQYDILSQVEEQNYEV